MVFSQLFLGTFLGGIISGLLTLYFTKKTNKSTTKHKVKEDRYKNMLLLMYTLVDFDKRKDRLTELYPKLNSKENLVEELRYEWANMSLYANDKVLLATKCFLENADDDNLNRTLVSMRTNLYDINTTLTHKDLQLPKAVSI